MKNQSLGLLLPPRLFFFGGWRGYVFNTLVSQFLDTGVLKKRAATAGAAFSGRMLRGSSAGTNSSPAGEGGTGTGRARTAQIPGAPRAANQQNPSGLRPHRYGEAARAAKPPRPLRPLRRHSLPARPRPAPPHASRAGSGARPPPSCTASAATRATRPEPLCGLPGEAGESALDGTGQRREAAAARKVKGDGTGERGGRRLRRLRRRSGSALTGKRLGGAMGGRAVAEAWSGCGRGHERGGGVV